MAPSDQLGLARIEQLVLRTDCALLAGGEPHRLVRADPAIARHRPLAGCRIDPRDGMPIVYSTARARRPHDNTGPRVPCPVCAGRTTGIIDVAPAGPGVTFINKNLFPIVYPRAGRPPRGASGAHFLQWTSNHHALDLHNVSLRHLEVVLARLAALEGSLLHGSTDYPLTPGGSRCDRPHHGYVGVIKNHGRLVGGSLQHGHQQIVHSNIRPLQMTHDMRFLEREGRSVANCLLADNPPELTLGQHGPVRALTPWFLRRPLQAMVLPLDTRKSYLHELGRAERVGMARALRGLLAALWVLMPRLGRETAYNLVLHNGPIGGLYLELLPWTQEYGGYEQQGLFVCAGTPEESHALYMEQLAG